MWHEFLLACRHWQRNRFLGVCVVALLAIGIGANTLIFSFVDAVLLQPLPVRDPDNLFLLEKTRAKQVRNDPDFFYRQYERLSERREVFQSMVAEQEWSDLSFQPFEAAGSVQVITTQIVSPNYFSELGLHPIAGRLLTTHDAVAQGDVPVVLSEQFWRSQFRGARDVIGGHLRVKSHPFLIVGVLPGEFHSLDVERAPDVRLPISAAPLLIGSTVERPVGEPIAFRILLRLAPGVSWAQAANVALTTVRPMEPELWRDWWTRSKRPSRETIEERIEYEQNYRAVLSDASRGISRLRDQFSNAVLLLMGAVALLMLGICANVGSLLIAKTQSRRQEIALRLAIGGDRLQVMGQLLREQLVLAVPSVLLGIVFSYAAAPWLVRLLPPPRGFVQYAATPQILHISPRLDVLLFAAGLAIVSVCVFGLLPSWRATGVTLADTLKSSGRTATNREVGFLLTACGVGLGVILGTASAATLRTYWTLQHLNPGFDRTHVVEFTINPEVAGYSAVQATAFRRDLNVAIKSLPGVRALSYANMGVMRGIGTKMTIVPQGKTLPERSFLNTNTNTVSPEYFDTLGVPLLAGRNLKLHDVGSKPQHIVVNRAFADLFFPRDEHIVGRAIVQGTDGSKPPMAVIVGVVGTTKYRSMREVNPPILYSAANDEIAGMFLYVRTSNDPGDVIGEVRNIVHKLDPHVPVIEAFRLEEEVQNTLWQERVVTLLSGFFGTVALVLSALGLYAALAYSVTRRSRELGVRIALGAQIVHLVKTVCSRIGAAVAVGLLAGGVGSVLLLHMAESLLFGIRPFDAESLCTAGGLLLLLSVTAAFGPTLRAAKTDPIVALREE